MKDMKIVVNAKDELLVESKRTNVNQLKDMVVTFVTNPRKEKDKPIRTKDAIISLQNDVQTTYEVYVQIYSHIHEAYATLRNDLARALFRTDNDQLTIAQKNEILKEYPLKLSEADPFIANS